jgi:hypothetical protein
MADRSSMLHLRVDRETKTKVTENLAMAEAEATADAQAFRFQHRSPNLPQLPFDPDV